MAPFTSEEVARLTELASEGKSAQEIAAALGRSTNSVHAKGYKLGLRFKRARVLGDLAGQTFGHWTVLREHWPRSRAGIKWRVRCVCGTVSSILQFQLVHGQSKSCGCAPRQTKRGLVLRYSERELALMSEMAAAGYSRQRIADALGRTHSGVSQRLGKLNITLRNPRTSKTLTIPIENDALELLQLEADRLGIRPRMLARFVLQVVARDHLWSALSDDPLRGERVPASERGPLAACSGAEVSRQRPDPDSQPAGFPQARGEAA